MKKIFILTSLLLLSSGCSLDKSIIGAKDGLDTQNEVQNLAYTRPASTINNLPIAQSTTCSFLRISTTTFEDPNNVFTDNQNKKIIYESKENSQANIIAFIDLDSDSPKMAGNNGQSELVKIIDTDEIVSLIEKNPLTTGGNIVVYTIYKQEGVATWTKQYKLLSTPFALLSMGYCQ